MIDSKGLTLVELVVVLIILMALSVLFLKNISMFNKANSIEDDCKKIYAFLQKARLEAFSEKKILNVALDATGEKLCETIQNECIVLNNQFASTGTGNFTISRRGLFKTSGSIHVTYIGGKPAYSCVVVSNTRVRLGEWDSGSCNPK